MRLFVFGLGYSARATLARLGPQLERAWGTIRDPARLPEASDFGATAVLFDGKEAAPDVRSALREADHILVSIAPDSAGDPVLRAFAGDLAVVRPKALVYLSTVGVYGDHQGAWVDEQSACRPVSLRSRLRIDAEASWRSFAGQARIPLAIVRLAGIYGPGRGPFEKIRNGTARRILKAGQVFNRIHVDDIAQIVEAALVQCADGIFNGSDDEPAPPQDVLELASKLLGVPPPDAVHFDAAELAPMARSFYGENKRVRNARIKRQLGIRLIFASYREGLPAVLAKETETRDEGGPLDSRAAS